MKDIESLKEVIKQHVSLGELLKIDGRITNAQEEEQFGCTFHGIDRKKSARYYRVTDTAYCWVCKERWDAISYIRKKEGMGFGEALNHIIKTYNIDVSVLPEATEEHVRKIQQRAEPKVDNKKLALEKISQAITVVRDDVDFPTYAKMVYAFMVLKHAVPEEQFLEQCTKLKSGMLRVFERLNRK
jgi:hypothetical protein